MNGCIQGPLIIRRVRGGKMNKALFAVFLIGIGITAAQTPPDQARQKAEAQRIDQERESLRQSAARSVPVIIGWPTLSPAGPVPIFRPLKKMEK